MNQHRSHIAWHELQTVLDGHERFVLTSHVRPDCDALGSELAMAELLASRGKSVRIVNADAVPPRLAFLDPHGQIGQLGSENESLVAAAQVILILDTGAWGQLGAMADAIRRSPARRVVIDHHASDSELDALMFKDAAAEATGRLVADFLEFLGVTLTRSMATALFAAIATDTGWFRFASTRSSTFQVAARLLEAGALPVEIYRQLYECDSLARARLRARVLSRLTTELAGRLVHTYVLASDFDETGARRSETEDFINMGLALAGTEVAVMFTEYPSGTVKVSFRSRLPACDCSRLAATFGGGGHSAAAGATLVGDMHSVRERVLLATRRALGQ
jgi:phosphoesterase RecJ-like protein